MAHAALPRVRFLFSSPLTVDCVKKRSPAESPGPSIVAYTSSEQSAQQTHNVGTFLTEDPKCTSVALHGVFRKKVAVRSRSRLAAPSHHQAWSPLRATGSCRTIGLQCRSALDQGRVSLLSTEAHHPLHQTEVPSYQEQSQDVGCSELNDSNGSRCRKEEGMAPLLEALVQAAARNDVLFSSPGHGKGEGAPAALKDAFGAEVSRLRDSRYGVWQRNEARHGLLRSCGTSWN
jgi:hypothetical protein